MTRAPIAEAVMEGLYQHRLLTAAQIHVLHTPDRLRRRTRAMLSELVQRGLVAAVPDVTGGRRKIFYLTPAGTEAVESAPTAERRRKLIEPEQACGPLQRHTLAVNDVGIAFVRAARARDDEFGPLSWHHEIAHPIGAPPGRKRGEDLIADALLTYQQDDDERIRVFYRLLELDRATMPAPRLAAKLARYARLYHHTIATKPGVPPVRFWETRYPVFPTVALVLDGDTPERLTRRRYAVLALCADDRDLRRTPQVDIAACLLDDLRTDGPFAPIWRRLVDPELAVDWLGRPATATTQDAEP